MARPRLIPGEFGGGGEGLIGGGGISPEDSAGPDYGGPMAEEGPMVPVEMPANFDPNLGRGSSGVGEDSAPGRGSSPKGPGGVRRRRPPPRTTPPTGPGGPAPTPPTPPTPEPSPGTPQPGPEPNPAPEGPAPIPGGPVPQNPMPVPGSARLRSAGLMGMGGGLQGGGLGTPFDPVADETSFDIDTLMKLLGGQ